MVVGKFDGTKQDRKSLPVRAQRDRGVTVKAGIVCPVATSSITPIGLGIAPGGDDRAALYIFKYTRPITGWGCARMFAGRLLGKMRREAGIISISNAIWRGCRVAK